MKNVFNLYKLSEKEQKDLSGGERNCRCACAYVNCGGSSMADNNWANYWSGPSGAISPHTMPQC